MLYFYDIYLLDIKFYEIINIIIDYQLLIN